MYADADEPDRCVIQPPDEEDEPAATLQLQLVRYRSGARDGILATTADRSPSSMRRTSIVLTAPILAAARPSRRAFPPYSCTTVSAAPSRSAVFFAYAYSFEYPGDYAYLEFSTSALEDCSSSPSGNAELSASIR